MSGFFGIGGTNSRQQNQSVGNLNNLFNFGLSTGQKGVATGGSTTAAGLSGLEGANSYWKGLMSGNRPAVMQAAAPEINAAQSGSDAAKRQLEASGTARGGGVAAANQQRKDAVTAQIDNAIFGVRPAAAKESAAVSGKIADVGTAQMEEALQALGISGSAASAAGRTATDARTQANAERQQTIQDIFGWATGGRSISG